MYRNWRLLRCPALIRRSHHESFWWCRGAFGNVGKKHVVPFVVGEHGSLVLLVKGVGRSQGNITRNESNARVLNNPRINEQVRRKRVRKKTGMQV